MVRTQVSRNSTNTKGRSEWIEIMESKSEYAIKQLKTNKRSGPNRNSKIDKSRQHRYIPYII